MPTAHTLPPQAGYDLLKVPAIRSFISGSMLSVITAGALPPGISHGAVHPDSGGTRVVSALGPTQVAQRVEECDGGDELANAGTNSGLPSWPAALTCRAGEQTTKDPGPPESVRAPALLHDLQRQLENYQEFFSAYESRLAEAAHQVVELRTRQTMLAATLRAHEEEVKMQRELLRSMEEADKHRVAELRLLNERLLSRWQTEHMIVKGSAWKVLRGVSDELTLKSHTRNPNFELDVRRGETLLFVVEAPDLSERERAALNFRLKRDKRGHFGFGARDANVRLPLRHGDTWTADDYYSFGSRLYILQESGRSAVGRFYVVARGDPKPAGTGGVPPEIQERISAAKKRLAELEERAAATEKQHEAMTQPSGRGK